MEMEQWEINLRKRLNETIPKGCYKITDNIFTGKGGYIEFEVAMKKKLMEMYSSQIEEIKSQMIVNKSIGRND